MLDLEMSKESLLLRLLASEARVDAHKFRTGHMNRDDFIQLIATLAGLGEAPIWIDDSASSTVLEIGAKARRLMRDRGLSLVIVNYLRVVRLPPTLVAEPTVRRKFPACLARSKPWPRN